MEEEKHPSVDVNSIHSNAILVETIRKQMRHYHLIENYSVTPTFRNRISWLIDLDVVLSEKHSVNGIGSKDQSMDQGTLSTLL